MHERRVHAVVVVLQHELPVSPIGMLEDAARDLDLAGRRALDQVVEGRAERAEEFQQ